MLLQDLRYGLRLFAKSPGFTAIAVLTMALGIGASTAVFSLLNGVLIQSLPYGDPARLVYVWSPIPRLPDVPREIGPNWPDYVDWVRMSHSFSSLAAWDSGYFNAAGKTGTTEIPGTRVSGNFFSTLEASAQLGRTIVPEDDDPRAARVAVISDAFWRSRFAAAASVLGSVLELDRQPYRIIGVMPPRFGYPHATDTPYDSREKQTDIWVPLRLTPEDKTDRNRAGGGTVFGRLKRGVDVRRAQAEMVGIESQLDPLHPPEIHGFTAWVQPMLDSLLGPVRPLMLLLMGAVLIVLAIGCANIANLLLARGAARMHEMGVRAAIGADRWRLVRQVLTESALLAVVGGICGAGAGWLGMRVLVRLAPRSIPRMDEVGFDARVLWFTVGASILTGLAFGLVPAIAAARVNLLPILAQGGGRGSTGRYRHWRDGVIVAEIALAVTLLAGAGLLLRSFQKLAATDLGFSRTSLTMKVTLDDRYSKPEDQVRFYRTLLERVRSIPGVTAAGGADMLPLGLRESVSFVEIEGRTLPKNSMANSRCATGEFFDAMGIRLLAGRMLNDRDIDQRPGVVLISRRFRDVYFPAEDPLGSHVRFGGGPQTPWATIVGVVEDVHHSSLEATPRPTFYSPLWRQPGQEIFLAIGAKAPLATVVPAVQAAARELDPSVAISDVHTMDAAIGEAGAKRRFQTAILGAFAGIAVFLAAIGIYGLMAYSVRQRTAEIGIRMAVGASRGRVVAMVLQRGMVLAAAGSVVGLGGALAATRLIRSWLYGVSATDALTFAVVPVVLLAIAAAACVVPAWRAARVDPVRAVWGR
jgi:putative ABC transport system permease protein